VKESSDQEVKIKRFVLSIESLQMNLNLYQQFHLVASRQVVQIHTLEINKPYPVLFARWLITQYGSSVLVTLQSEENIDVEIYLPKRYSDVVDDTDIKDINTGRKNYNL